MQIYSYRFHRNAFILGIAFELMYRYSTNERVLTIEFLIWGVDISWDLGMNNWFWRNYPLSLFTVVSLGLTLCQILALGVWVIFNAL